MMPSSEIKREEKFVDNHKYEIIIQAGDNGWSVSFTDGSVMYKDVATTTDENFKEALKTAEESLGKLKLIKNEEDNINEQR